jgi:signal transduction histidine kinase
MPIEYYKIALGIFVCLVFVSLTSLFSYLLARLYITKVKKHAEEMHAKDMEYQTTLTETIVETQEQLLQNISRDLHDDAGQQITALNFQIENYKHDHPEEAARLGVLSQSLNHLSQSVRSISHSLSSQLVMQQDLSKAIRNELERLQKNSRIQFGIDVSETKLMLRDDEKLIIYRIFQESLNNCLKHARAKSIRVTLVIQPKFCLRIEDDGKGFDLNEKSLSLGMITMKRRAELIDCTLEIASKPGHGTQLVLSRN